MKNADNCLFDRIEMAKEELTPEMYVKSIKIALKLAKVLTEEGGKNPSTTFMMFCVAQFTSTILSVLKQYNNDIDIATEYTNLVKKMMEEMDGDAKARAAKSLIKEHKDEFDKLNLTEEDILRMMINEKKGS
jgi:hypothetical protein